ncbi:MAG: FUSC family protein [Caulobacteraceae bacterium]
MIADVVSAFLARKAEARHTVRVTAAVLAAYVIYAAFALPQGYWAVFTTLIIMQASIGGTVGAAMDRMYGTLLGAAVGGLLAWLRPQTPVGLGLAVALASAVTAYIAMLRPNMKVAPVTAAIMLLSSAGKLGPLHAAAYRVVEIGLGSVIGVAATLLIFPARSRTVVAERTLKVLQMLAELLGHYAGWLARAEVEPAADMHPLHDRIRNGIVAVEAAVADAERERAARLGYHHLSPATPRTLWRIRSEAVAMGRALREPWPDTVRAQLAEAGRGMLEAEAAMLEACATALNQQIVVETPQALADAHDAFQDAVASLRRERVTRDLTFDTVGSVFSFAFALESLYAHLGDMADRINESVLERPTGMVNRLRTTLRLRTAE